MRMSDHAFNRLSVLKKLRAAEPVSRTDLAQLSGLNGGTITAITRDLVDRGLVVEEREATPGRGRPRINLRINSDGAYAAAATMTDDGRLLAEIVDLRGQSVASHSGRILQTTRLEDLARQFSVIVAQAIAASGAPRDRIAQVGIGLPAILDSRSGVVTFFETFEDVPFPFGEAVARDVGVPVRIDNNINLLARGEHWFGEGARADDFTLVLIDLGLGAARYRDGRLVTGRHGAAAEIGHTKIVAEGGRACHCGGQGCLQTYCSISAIVYQAAEREGKAAPGIAELRPTFSDLVDRAKAGDAQTIELMESGARHLGRALANHINMDDPERIVVLTRRDDWIPLIADSFFAALNRDTLPALRAQERIAFRQTDDMGFARGAAAMVLEQLYQER